MQTQKTPTYLKAITLRDHSDIHTVKEDIKKGMILVLRVTPLAQKNVDELRKVVEEIYSIAKTQDADIARLGEERIIVTPSGVKIWRAEYDLK
ncbi:MAG: cell division protein SepF [Thaumarchaeota archaeon]|nr:cell division protein SepF [Nitrososphaerota archaeon]MDE1866430.1 cell division protein SepF [Nitrososphaerota archaeon]